MTDRTHPDSGFPIAYSHYATYAEYVEALHARIAELEAQLEAIGAGGVSGPLMGKPQEMPDLSALTERGAKAWAGVDAQGLREGFTAADMATASAQGFRDGVASPAASAGSEPVAWQVWWGLGEMRPHWPPFKTQNDAADHASMIKSRTEVRPLYTHPSPLEGMVGGWTKPHRTITYTCPVCAASLERQE